MTIATLLPYLLFGAGWLARHFNVLGHVGFLSKLLGGLHQPAAPASPTPALPPVSIPNRPVLSDAVNAAIKSAVSEVAAGHYSNIKAELIAAAEAAAKAAAAAAIADLQKKAAA